MNEPLKVLIKYIDYENPIFDDFLKRTDTDIDSARVVQTEKEV